MPEGIPAGVRTIRGRSRFRSFVQLLRRAHLYAGLLMLPWVILFGITAFLFNHPTAFSDQATTSFGREGIAGTPFQTPISAPEIARQAVAGLQARAAPGVTYTLVDQDQARFTREFVFATVKAEGQEISVLFDVHGTGGTIRSRPSPPPPTEDRAPFAVGGRANPRGGNRPTSESGPRAERGSLGSGDALKIDNPLHEQALATLPILLERTGFPQGEATVTSVPDVSFLMETDGKVWRVTYNCQTGVLNGKLAEEVAEPEAISARRFLTRLHTTHGYPGELNAKWAWALIVDVMAFIMVFWGCSGLLMWWQIRSTRWLGLLVLLVSAGLASWLGIEMHDLLSAGGR